MPLNAFIIRPFGIKEIIVTAPDLVARLKTHSAKTDCTSVLRRLEPIGDGPEWKVAIDFDAVDRLLIAPVLERLRIHGETASAVVVAGNIREDMFHRLLTADVVIADLSVYNPNVFYELGIRQAFRDKYTFLIRSNLSEYPFDLRTDRYFEYDLTGLGEANGPAVDRLTTALRATISSYEADSPVFKLLPQLEAEDRGRFLTVPGEFSEEVERARRHRQCEHLRLLAVECEGFLWEIEGLREVGRAQFDSNFIEGAKLTWEGIVNRYPDDVEANTVLSTVYQRLNDVTRSEQALARVSRIGSLSAQRQSVLRSLNGRNLKEAWTQQWLEGARTSREQQCAALLSPLLQRAYDAYEQAFKADLNNAYAGLNALSLLVIQTELADKLPDVWRSIRGTPDDAARDLLQRKARIRQLIAALELAVESERERLRREGATDAWFCLLAAAVACILSDQPEHVAQLYQDAMYFAPDDAEQSTRRALELYRTLEIRGRDYDKSSQIGTIGSNTDRALSILSDPAAAPNHSNELKRILMFMGLRLNHTVKTSQAFPGDSGDAQSKQRPMGFPEECVDEVRLAIGKAIEEEKALGGKILFGIAAGANGGDLLFHEACRDLRIPTRLCLALPREPYVGQYVAPAGRQWVEKFSLTYRHVRGQGHCDDLGTAGGSAPVNVFTDTNELPRWLQGKPYYNAGRRNNLWMLQHAMVAATRFRDNAEVTLFALWDGEHEGELGTGGIGHVVQLASMAGIKVHTISPPPPKAHLQVTTEQTPPSDTKSVLRLHS
jgi:hypothetical protein